MTALFKKKTEAELRATTLKIRVTQQELEKIRHNASIRQMNVSEFIRRAALGRKANVDYETEIVCALSDVGRAIRQLYAALVERGLPPMQEDLQPIVTHAIAAIQRIGK